MMKRNWMAELAAHYEKIRQKYPHQKLMIVFDIDGTILDMRYMMLDVLKTYDTQFGTRFFTELKIQDITIHETQLPDFLNQMGLPPEHMAKILDWYHQKRWSEAFILHAHQPFRGVMDVIRWFQLQPNTYVGINSGRPESVRKDTLHSLNELGKEYKVHFKDELLHLNSRGWDEGISKSKAEGMKFFTEKGYHIFAVVDNEPVNLKEMATVSPNNDTLFLHANTIFKSRIRKLPPNFVRGREYDITDLIRENHLPRHIQMVWHGINDQANLRQFLGSDISWGECDVRLDPTGNKLILRHDSFRKTPLQLDEPWLTFEEFLTRMQKYEKSVKVDLKSGGILVDKVIEHLRGMGWSDEHIWFNANIERLHEYGFRKLRDAFPDAILQCPIEFLYPLISSTPDKAHDILNTFTSWGINRFSVNWQIPEVRTIIRNLMEWEMDINIYNVPDLEAFLQAVLLTPRSITADFNFPQWYYFGRGSGENDFYYEYSMKRKQLKSKTDGME